MLTRIALLEIYRDLGFGVIPLRPNSKVAAIEWSAYRTERAGWDTVSNWHAEFPGANWAIVTGKPSGIVVLDADNQAAIDLIESHGEPQTLSVATPRGRHFYYRYPEGRTHVPSRVNVFDGEAKADIRADGGYVVVPASTIDGQAYRWEQDPTEQPIGNLPDWLAAHLEADTPQDTAQLQEPPSSPVAYANEAMGRELTSVIAAEPGSRNNALNSAAFSLGQLLACNVLDEVVVRSALSAAGSIAGLEHAEVQATIDSGLAAGRECPRWEVRQSEDIELLSADDIMARSAPSALIDGLLMADSVAVLFGSSGVGKSFLAMDWAARVANGVSWLGRSVSLGSTVYIVGEGLGGIPARLAALKDQHALRLPNDRIRFVPHAIELSDETWVSRLTRAIRAQPIVSPTLIVIDTLAKCFGAGDENQAGDMEKFMKGVQSLKREFHPCTILIIHHSGKDQTKGARGSSALRAAIDTELELKSSGNKIISLSATKQRDIETVEGVRLRIRTVATAAGDSSCVVVGFEPANDNRGSADSRPVPNPNDEAAIQILVCGGPLSYVEWERAAVAAGMRPGTFKNCRKRLLEQERVSKTASGKYAAVGPAEPDEEEVPLDQRQG